MPSWKTHTVIAGVTCSWVVYYCQHPVEYVLVGVLGGLFPDVDTRHSFMGRFLPLWIFFKHRGFTHSLLGWWVFSLLITIMTNGTLATMFAVGYLTHLVLDSLTPRGVNFLWPLAKRYRRR